VVLPQPFFMVVPVMVIKGIDAKPVITPIPFTTIKTNYQKNRHGSIVGLPKVIRSDS